MPRLEWVNLSAAPIRLATLWDISPSILVPHELEYWVSGAKANYRVLTPTAVAETKIKRWLRQQSDDPPGRKTDIFDWAKAGELIGEEGKALGRKSFGRAWDDAAPHAWKRPGKRTKFLQLSEITPRLR